MNLKFKINSDLQKKKEEIEKLRSFESVCIEINFQAFLCHLLLLSLGGEHGWQALNFIPTILMFPKTLLRNRPIALSALLTAFIN